MKVKVCGVTSYEDAALVLDEGVDALGFNFYPSSPRYIRPEDARAIVRRIPPFAVTVGLFVNVAKPGLVEKTARAAGVQILQLHGDETPDYCRELKEWPLIKAFRVGPDGIPAGIDQYPVQGILFDSKDDALFGGTGKIFQWDLVRDLRRFKPVLLAGGLRPDNVLDAIRTVNPYALDVCSGIESAPGRKDAVKLKQFMREVRNAEQADNRA
jgi:phosphoribosylanthranilate isomerase